MLLETIHYFACHDLIYNSGELNPHKSRILMTNYSYSLTVSNTFLLQKLQIRKRALAVVQGPTPEKQNLPEVLGIILVIGFQASFEEVPAGFADLFFLFDKIAITIELVVDIYYSIRGVYIGINKGLITTTLCFYVSVISKVIYAI